VNNVLLDHLEKCEGRLRRKKRKWKSNLCEGLQAAQEKLKKYYNNTTTSHSSTLYGIAILLNPGKKESYWRSKHWTGDSEWMAIYWHELEELDAEEYAHFPVPQRRKLPNLGRVRASLSDVLNSVVKGQQQAITDEERISDVDAEWLDYRQFGRLW
jgi:hypothetical protein